MGRHLRRKTRTRALTRYLKVDFYAHKENTPLTSSGSPATPHSCHLVTQLHLQIDLHIHPHPIYTCSHLHFQLDPES